MGSDIFEFKINTRPLVFYSRKISFKLLSRVTASGLSWTDVKQADVHTDCEHCEGLEDEKDKLILWCSENYL